MVAVPGAGKTTVLNKVLEKVEGLKLVNFGDLMFEQAVKYFRIANRDEMRKKIGLHDYRVIQERVAARISRMEGDLLIDTHAVVKTNLGYYPGLPCRVVDLINPDAIVFLEYRPEDIIQRRVKDLKAEEKYRRYREIEEVEKVQEHQDRVRDYAIAAANHARCYFVHLRFLKPEKYPFQHAEEASKSISELVEALREAKAKEALLE